MLPASARAAECAGGGCLAPGLPEQSSFLTAPSKLQPPNLLELVISLCLHGNLETKLLRSPALQEGSF